MADFSWTWVDADGNSTALSEANGVRLLRPAVGLEMPDVELSYAANTTRDGNTLIRRRVSQRAVVLAMYLDNGSSVIDLIGTWANRFVGPGRLQMSNGTRTRELRDVYYEAGLEGVWQTDTHAPDAWAKRVVSFVTGDPYWYSTSATTDTLTPGSEIAFDAAGTTFDSSAAPFGGGAPDNVAVGGDVPAFPVFTITGAFSAGLVIGVEGGAEFTVANGIPSGSTVTVDCDPNSANYGPRTGTKGVNWSILTTSSRLPELEPGTVAFYTTTAGTDVNSDIDVAWYERWLTP